MHFQFDKKFLNITKIFKIKNKNFQGSFPLFLWPKSHFPNICSVSVIQNTLVQGVKEVVGPSNQIFNILKRL
jgi:hypothetical protein